MEKSNLEKALDSVELYECCDDCDGRGIIYEEDKFYGSRCIKCRGRGTWPSAFAKKIMDLIEHEFPIVSPEPNDY